MSGVCTAPTLADVISKGQGIVDTYLKCISDTCQDGGQALKGIYFLDICDANCDQTVVSTNCGLPCTAMAADPRGAKSTTADGCPKKCGKCGTYTIPPSAGTGAGSGTGAGGATTPAPGSFGSMTEATCQSSGRSTDAQGLHEISTPLLVVGITIFVIGFLVLPAVLYLVPKFRAGLLSMSPRQKMIWVMCVVCLGLLALGQGGVSFDVVYAFNATGLSQTGNAFRYDYWTGVEELWRLESYLLALALIGCSGVWPFIKNVVVLAAGSLNVWLMPEQMHTGEARRAREYVWLRRLAVLGKFGLMDIVTVIAIIAIIAIDTPLGGDFAALGGRLTFSASPRQGTLMIVIDLLLARMITTVVLHFLPVQGMPSALESDPQVLKGMKSDSRNKVDEAAAASGGGNSSAPAPPPTGASVNRSSWRYKLPLSGPLGLVVGISSLVFFLVIFLGFLSDVAFVSRTVTVMVQVSPAQPASELSHATDDWGFWQLIEFCGSSFGEAKGLRVFLTGVALFVVFILGMLQALITSACGFVAFFQKGKEDSNIVLRWRLLNALQIMTEWCSLEVTMFALLIFGPDIETLGKDLGGTLVAGVCSSLNLKIGYKAYFWVLLLVAIFMDIAAMVVLWSKEFGGLLAPFLFDEDKAQEGAGGEHEMNQVA